MGCRYLGFYCFHNVSPVTLHRLIQFNRMNPDVTFVPCFGIPQRIYIPGLVDLGSLTLKQFNWFFLRSKHIVDWSQNISKRVESIRRRVEIQTLQNALNRIGMKLYSDFTPMGYYNLDLVILNWFSSEGRNLDFDFLIFLEHDLFATRTIESLYNEYMNYDAGFVDYQEADSSWGKYRRIFGNESILRWLRSRNLKPLLYRGLYVGAMISRKVLSKLEKEVMPFGHCEMTLPSIITGLGYSCARLNFPMVQYRPPRSKADVEANSSLGLFHPVYEDLET